MAHTPIKIKDTGVSQYAPNYITRKNSSEIKERAYCNTPQTNFYSPQYSLKIILLPLAILLTFNSFSQISTAPTLKQKIGQMIMVGFRDTVITDTSQITLDIKNQNIGGVVLYEYDTPSKSRPRNISSKPQLQKLNTDLQKFSATPLFIGIDEEGGLVSRFKPKYGFEKTVTAQYLGEINNPDSTRFYAKKIANNCKQMGINMNFGPVVDINTNPYCPVIGKLGRSFSANSDSVVFHSSIYIKEHEKLGIISSLKHFPGHGSAQNDSHKGFTDVSESWTKEELQPYAQLLNKKVTPVVMTAHTFNENIDSVYPATLSLTTINMLRKDLNYNGLILSDDMMMLAIANHFGFEQAIKLAINAGVDILIFSNNINHYNPKIAQQAVNAIVKLVENGEVSESRINESYIRIMKVKNTMNNE